MKFTYLSAIICLFFTTTILAEMDYFIAPGPNTQYKSGDTISFVVEDMPDEDDQNINANLHKSDGSFVKTIQTWSSQNVDESGEEFPFDWLVDVTEGGDYYVEIRVGTNRDDATQSYPFTIEVDEGESSAESDAAAPADDPQSETAPEPVQGAYDQEPQEKEEDEAEEPTKSKLSLHNTQSKVAHISSHSDIDTVSDSPSSPPAEPSADHKDHPKQQKQHKEQKQQKPKQDVKHETSGKLGKVAAALTSKLPIGQKDGTIAKLDNTKLAVLPKPQGKSEPLMPETKPSASLKELAAADDIAVEQEKKWIAEQQKGSAASSPSNTKEKPASTPQKAKQPQNQQKQQPQKQKHGKSQPSPPKPEAKQITDEKKTTAGLQEQIKAKAKETVDRVKQQAKDANQRESDQQKLSLAEQEALDDKAAKKELESINNSRKTSSKEKRDAYRKIMSNRAKFTKQSLQ
ncbi:hypothetical protein BCR42DRAFT_386608 [Absidia repens]|uniref:Ser-Thr-rich glycosyl-phosphatidyl-inositol-anchored membrane family-domain-containing protein n=1 Tax=Absidia repens TaxID=90262 RepID=A0A1X2J2J7_9FUNG|nr:hypothetical protein BCR42DRAFT_386608 [Absidia repens]